jgi:hypothetical protein
LSDFSLAYPTFQIAPPARIRAIALPAATAKRRIVVTLSFTPFSKSA